ncbi:hypothetical protein FQZ97_876270 [compost metagenome]
MATFRERRCISSAPVSSRAEPAANYSRPRSTSRTAKSSRPKRAQSRQARASGLAYSQGRYEAAAHPELRRVAQGLLVRSDGATASDPKQTSLRTELLSNAALLHFLAHKAIVVCSDVDALQQWLEPLQVAHARSKYLDNQLSKNSLRKVARI